MPSFYPEGDTVQSKDNELRSLHKIVSLVAAGGGGGGGLAFSTGSGSPEGAISGKPGDMYYDTGTMFHYQKITGVNTTTGWGVT